MDGFAPILVPAARERFSAMLIPGATPPAAATDARPQEAPAPPPAPAAPDVPMVPEAELHAAVAAAAAQARDEATAAMAAQLAEMAEKTATAQRLIAALDAAAKAQAEEARALVGQMVLSSVQRIVGQSAVLQSMALHTAFGDVAAGMLGERTVLLRVRPDQVSDAQELVADRQGWVVREDASIHAGLRIETERGCTDATLETAINSLDNAINAWKEEA